MAVVWGDDYMFCREQRSPKRSGFLGLFIFLLHIGNIRDARSEVSPRTGGPFLFLDFPFCFVLFFSSELCSRLHHILWLQSPTEAEQRNSWKIDHCPCTDVYTMFRSLLDSRVGSLQVYSREWKTKVKMKRKTDINEHWFFETVTKWRLTRVKDWAGHADSHL